MSQALREWVDTIDIGGDGKKDGPEYANLKNALVEDAVKLSKYLQEGKMNRSEYERHMGKMKQILERHHASVQAAYDRYNQERKVVYKETEKNWKELFWSVMDSISLAWSKAAMKARNVMTDGLSQLQQKLISEDTLQSYTNEGGNDFITIKDFERQLKSRPIEQLNALALKNYFAYLQVRSPITKELLEQKLGSSEKLLQLSVLWGTKLEHDAHARNGGGIIWKIAATGKVLVSGTSERKIEKNIFKQVIIENLKKSQLEEDFFDVKEGSQEYRAQLDKKLGKTNYETIIKEFKNEFKGKEVTSEMVRGYFEKKSAESEKRIQESERIQEKTVKNKTVREMLGSCQISENFMKTWLGEREMSKLTPEENKKVADIMEKNAISLSLPAKRFLANYKEIDGRRKEARISKVLAGRVSSEMLAKASNNGQSDKLLERVAKSSVDVAESGDSIRSKERQGIYREVLTQIWYAGGIMDACKDQKTLKGLISRLEEKNLTRTELYKDLKPHLLLEETRAEYYIMTKENITEEQLSEQKRQGRRIEGFSESIYKEEKGALAEKTSLKWEERVVKNVSGNEFSSTFFFTAISSLQPGEHSDTINLWGEKLSVKKTVSGFEVETRFQTIPCSDIEEVENYLDSRKFLSDIGCGFMMGGMDNILTAISAKNPENLERFDMKKGFSPKQQMEVMKTMIQTLNLPIGFEGITASELEARFRAYFFSQSSDGSLRKAAGARDLINANGSFAFEGMTRLIST